MRTAFIVVVFLIMSLTIVDFSMTDHALSTGRYREANPIARFYVTKPALSVPIISFGNYATSSALINLHEKSRTWAWAAAGALVVGKIFVLSHNAKVLR